MTKEEILEKSQMENGNKDIADLEVQSKGAVVAYLIAGLLCVCMTVMEKFLSGTFNPGYLTVFFGMLFTMFCVKVSIAKKKHEIFVAVCYGALFACGLIWSIVHFLSGVAV